MLIRKIKSSEIAEAAEIYESARRFMREAGNPEQWRGDYPSARDVKEDIPLGASYVCEDRGEIIGVFHFHVGEEPDYLKIYDGEWKNAHPYGVIHRIAVKYYGRKIADFIYSECFRICKNLKIDTHRDNLPMQHSLEKNGFEYCGKIRLSDGEERLAYQKTR